jgi:hypothetical protein
MKEFGMILKKKFYNYKIKTNNLKLLMQLMKVVKKKKNSKKKMMILITMKKKKNLKNKEKLRLLSVPKIKKKFG